MLVESRRSLQRKPSEEEPEPLQKRRRRGGTRVVTESGSFGKEMEKEEILKFCGVHSQPVPSMQAGHIARHWVDDCAPAAKTQAYLQAKRAVCCAGLCTQPEKEAGF